MSARRENSFKKYLVRIMGTRWDVQSHEDKYSIGIPDLSFAIGGCNGWIELKQIEKYGSKMKPSKYTRPQINWLVRRHRFGGGCFVFVKVESDYYLFGAKHARDVADGQSQEWYETNCITYWEGVIDPCELLEALVKKQDQ